MKTKIVALVLLVLAALALDGCDPGASLVDAGADSGTDAAPADTGTDAPTTDAGTD